MQARRAAAKLKRSENEQYIVERDRLLLAVSRIERRYTHPRGAWDGKGFPPGAMAWAMYQDAREALEELGVTNVLDDGTEGVTP